MVLVHFNAIALESLKSGVRYPPNAILLINLALSSNYHTKCIILNILCIQWFKSGDLIIACMAICKRNRMEACIHFLQK